VEELADYKINRTEIISEWVGKYSDSLYSWAFYKTTHRETAEDLVQDTFLSAFQAIDKFENKSEPKTWLFSILNNKIYDYHRKKFKNLSSVLPNKEQKSDEDFDSNFFDDNDKWIQENRPQQWNDTQNLLDNNEFLAVLHYCMENLPETWNSAIQFKYISEKDSDDICKELGINTTNYWQILHRAKLKLRQCVENKWFGR